MINPYTPHTFYGNEYGRSSSRLITNSGSANCALKPGILMTLDSANYAIKATISASDTIRGLANGVICVIDWKFCSCLELNNCSVYFLTSPVPDNLNFLPWFPFTCWDNKTREYTNVLTHSPGTSFSSA